MFQRILQYFKKETQDDKDYSLNSGERQIAETIEGIREDHLTRYRLVQDYIDKYDKNNFKNGLDIFCGNGYGTYMLSKNNVELSMVGIDGSNEAVSLAQNVYTLKNNSFFHKLFPFKLEKNIYDIIVCFESLEHVEKDKMMFKEIVNSAKKNALIIVSVPNDNCHSLEKNPHIFHYRHYNHNEFLEDFQNDLQLIDWYGQNVYEFENGVCTFQLLTDKQMQPVKDHEGQVNIYIFRKI